MWKTGEKARITDIAGFVLLVYVDDGQPLLLTLPIERTKLCPVFSTIEKAYEAMGWMKVTAPTKPKRITDTAEFLASFDGHDVMVAADPYIYHGRTRWTAIGPTDV